MRAVFLAFVRLGPTLVYGVGTVFAASMVLLALYPSSPMAWGLYLTTRPVLRLPVFMLLGIPGVEAWHLVVVLALLAICGVFLARHPKRLARARFVHAHVALLALVLANAEASRAEASRLGPSLPGYIDWTLPVPATALGAVLLIVAALACLSCHAEIIRRIYLHINNDRLLA